jgi:hypothetical protein
MVMSLKGVLCDFVRNQQHLIDCYTCNSLVQTDCIPSHKYSLRVRASE